MTNLLICCLFDHLVVGVRNCANEGRFSLNRASLLWFGLASGLRSHIKTQQNTRICNKTQRLLFSYWNGGHSFWPKTLLVNELWGETKVVKNDLWWEPCPADKQTWHHNTTSWLRGHSKTQQNTRICNKTKGSATKHNNCCSPIEMGIVFDPKVCFQWNLHHWGGLWSWFEELVWIAGLRSWFEQGLGGFRLV